MLKLEVGKQYVRADGLVTKIVEHDSWYKAYACDGSADGSGWWYNPDGKLCGFEDAVQMEDLVEEFHE